jgi:hypothetical protein
MFFAVAATLLAAPAVLAVSKDVKFHQDISHRSTFSTSDPIANEERVFGINKYL